MKREESDIPVLSLDGVRLDGLYWQLKELGDPAAAERFLADVERRSPTIAAELRRMLAVEPEVENFLNLRGDRTREDVADDGTDDRLSGWSARLHTTAHSSIGHLKQIGPYRLLELIGEGGMGVVYLAEQTRPVRRKVALKIIKPGMHSRQVIARFEAERQALAMMDHPNIAKVLDAGTTENGLPYFVMDLVRGIPITEYCDRSRLDVRRRLEMFQSLCEALQHAHSKGIIHRDIKPSNVLVTEHDGTPVVTVIDFGVAKAIEENLTEKTLYTGIFQMIGTPLYMSPEQASLSNLDVDTRSDVYSSGVLLYELVSGTLPIDRESAKEMGLDRLRQYISDTDPLRPSRRLSSLKEGRETIAAQRGMSGTQLSKFVQSELDWIIMRAMEKDRQRRYQSPRELADDISRYLAGEAVQACPPTLAYRTEGQRHRARARRRLDRGMFA